MLIITHELIEYNPNNQQNADHQEANALRQSIDGGANLQIIVFERSGHAPRIQNRKEGEGHAAMVYKHDNTTYYISLYPGGANEWYNTCFGNCFGSFCGRPAAFSTFQEDSNRINNRAWNTHIYHISGERINIPNLHLKLITHLRKYGQFELRQVNRVIDQDENGAPIIEAPPPGAMVSPIPDLEAPDRNNFKLFANTCCCPIFYKHNCTSIVLQMLSYANIRTDLHCGPTAIRAVAILLYVAGLAISIHEASETPFNNDKSEEDQRKAAIASIVISVVFIILTLILSYRQDAKNQLARNFIFKSNPLLIDTRMSVCLAIIPIFFSIAIFIGHLLPRKSTITLLPEEESIFIGAAVGVLILLLIWTFSFCKDRRNGCTNPSGLKTMFDRGHRFSRYYVNAPIEDPPEQLPTAQDNPAYQ